MRGGERLSAFCRPSGDLSLKHIRCVAPPQAVANTDEAKDKNSIRSDEDAERRHFERRLAEVKTLNAVPIYRTPSVNSERFNKTPVILYT